MIAQNFNELKNTGKTGFIYVNSALWYGIETPVYKYIFYCRPVINPHSREIVGYVLVQKIFGISEEGDFEIVGYSEPCEIWQYRDYKKFMEKKLSCQQ